MKVISPTDKAVMLVFKIITAEPSSRSIIEIARTLEPLILPEGIGLLFVLSIRASVFRSWYWFSAAELQASRKIPITGYIKSKLILFAPRKYPSAVVNETITVMRIFTVSANKDSLPDSREPAYCPGVTDVIFSFDHLFII